jgi:drug/metabolite transporter (DMT)-like permease
LAARHDTFEIMLFRSGIGLVLVTLGALALGRLGEVRADRLGGHLVRNSFHFAGQNLWFLALATVPLAQVFALEFTSPLWVILLAPLVLGERLTVLRLVAVGLGFLGILIVTRPDPATIGPGTLAALACAVCFAATTLMTKRLTRGESIVGILFWLTLMQLVMALVCAGWDGQVTLPDATTLPWLCLVGLCGVSAHLCLTTALTLAPASFVVPIDFARLPLIAVVGWLVYDEVLDPFVLIGGAVIFAGILVNLRAAAR